MDKMKMQTNDLADENFKKLKELFPNAVTETINENGEVVRAIDKDVLRQEINAQVVEGPDERYQFTWPDKRKAQRLAASPITAALRPCREESVNFDTTENVYIEGDNLDVLKLLRETYLGKVKMIYIDPPYNTGNDFIYEDDFKEDRNDFFRRDNQYDDQGNRLVQNTESNGSFHTDWLNMIYPRLRVAKDLLAEDGVIFISIDDNEIENIKRVCDEIYGSQNFIATIVRNTNSSKNQSLFVSVSHEYCLIFAKDIEFLKAKHAENKWSVPKNNVKEYLDKVRQMQEMNMSAEEITEELKTLTKYPRFIDFTNYWYFDERGLYMKDNLGGVAKGNMTPLFNPLRGKNDPLPPGGFRYNNETLSQLVKENRIHFHLDGSLPRLKRYLSDYMSQRPKSIMSDDQRPDYSMMKEFDTPFDNPKQLSFIKRIVSIEDPDAIIMDFFSGSATTAHAVMQLNAEDGGKRKFLMVQIPENCPEDSEAFKAGYKNICEIGKERIRRAGKMIKDENPLTTKTLDIGFRVFKLDSSNMKDVYYSPSDTPQKDLLGRVDNIKEGRTPEDLLFQVMLEFGIPLSSKIKESVIAGKKVFNVEDNYLIACFDDAITEETITAIAKEKPQYVVLRDSGFKTDSVAANFEQIFATYSPDTTRRVL